MQLPLEILRTMTVKEVMLFASPLLALTPGIAGILVYFPQAILSLDVFKIILISGVVGVTMSLPSVVSAINYEPRGRMGMEQRIKWSFIAGVCFVAVLSTMAATSGFIFKLDLPVWVGIEVLIMFSAPYLVHKVVG